MLNRFPLHAAVLALLLGSWYLVKDLFSVNDLILPTPDAIGRATIHNAPLLLAHATITGLEAIAGLVIGTLAALQLAVAMLFVPPLQTVVYPYVIALKAIPLVALAPLLSVWLGTGTTAKVVLAAVISFFPVLVNTIHGFSSVAPEALDLFRTLRATKWEILWHLRLPHALPTFFQGLKVSATFAVIGAVVAEFVAAQQGIGHLIKSSTYFLDTALTFAGVFVAALLGLGLFALVTFTERRIVHWE